MTSKRTLIRGGQVYDHEGDVHKPAVADILIEDDKILSYWCQSYTRRRARGHRCIRMVGSARAYQCALSFT
jgi:hypothetical protein